MNGILNQEATNMSKRSKDGTWLKTNKQTNAFFYLQIRLTDMSGLATKFTKNLVVWSRSHDQEGTRIYQIREGFSVSNFSTTRDRRPQFPLTKLTPYNPRIHEVS